MRTSTRMTGCTWLRQPIGEITSIWGPSASGALLVL
jgi:hypothetical protein